MARRVIGYIDGHPQYEDLGPAAAHVAGFGGRAIEPCPRPKGDPTSDSARRKAAKRLRGEGLEGRRGFRE